MTAGINRRGACPALSAPMQTGDGLLVRLHPSGEFTINQLIGLCKSAVRHGNGVMEITARGSLQVRGLSAESAQLFAVDVDALNIAVRSGVPVDMGPIAGLDPAETCDPRPLAESILSQIVEAGLSGRLGPKVSVVVDGGGQFGLDRIAGDVRLDVIPGTQGSVWRVSLAGTAQNAKFVCETTASHAVDLTVTVLERIASLGKDARGRDLDIRLLRRELKSFAATEQRQASSERSPGTLGQAIELTDSRVALPVALPFGSIEAGALAGFLETARIEGCDAVRLAPERRLLLLCPDMKSASRILDEAGSIELIVSDNDPGASISACAGAPSCASAHFDTKAAALDIARQAGPLLGDMPVHVSGCGKGCAHPAPASITLVGDENGIGIVVNGTARDEPVGYVASAEAGRYLARFAGLVKSKRASGESIAALLASPSKVISTEIDRKQA